MKVLELFCGTKSMAKVFKARGHKVFTVDIEERFKPDLCKNILDLETKDIPFKPDIIWASPPCTCFSVASLYHYWKNGKPKSYKTFMALAIVQKTIELIKDLDPKYWFIENPRGMLRKQDIIKDLPRKTVTYCQYGDFRQKPTDIWTNCHSWIPKKPCSPGDKCHASAKRGEDRGTQYLHGSEKRSVIPKGLCEEVCQACEGNLKVKQEVLK